MNYFDTLFDFATKKSCGTIEVRFIDLMEIAQGGPMIGTLVINDNPIASYRFGGPILFTEGFVFAPVFIRIFCVAGFKISKIDIESLNVVLLGKLRDFIFLDKVEEGRLYFYEDNNKTDRFSMSI